jgi:hypothetical protein
MKSVVKHPSYGALQTDIQSDMAFFFLRMRLLDIQTDKVTWLWNKMMVK